MPAMKICIVTSSFPMNHDDSFAAAGKACKDFALELEKSDHEVFVLAPRFPGDENSFGNLKIRRFSWRGSGKPLSMLKLTKPGDLLEMIRFLYAGRKNCLDFIKENKVDRIMSMWAVPGGLFAFFAGRRYGTPYDVWALGADIWAYGRMPVLKRIVRKVLKSAALVYADGKELCGEVKKLSGRNCAFLPHLSNLDFDKAVPLGLEKEKTHFLFVGRWEAPKGIDVLIEAVNLLQAEESGFHLHVIGGGSFERLIKEKVGLYGLSEKVTLYGWVEQPLLAAYMKSCHVLVIPSRVESIPCVYSEAMSAGIPVVATDAGDMGLLTKEYGVGRIARSEDPASLKREMQRMMKEDLEPYRINTAKAAVRWSLHAAVSQYMTDLERMIERKEYNG